ncbi:EamA domain-containing membrane protein RarD [Tistlia consotensis]|uniref:EamA domain-containing membrane protein RarD n=1 Tax=Tistlia consotensis USBA 355 TaxID=560819 RepID=A0A1Y6BHT1_9PROT|nr:DMT family transporter [Tistlia consotensis]SMF11895.1 EamA domain-containing membrane protein RarD [Tistlia consotensis USBA 355]SNR51556.1 EamA domain-containing membrane protein RarD [Tistlia consotensis]
MRRLLAGELTRGPQGERIAQGLLLVAPALFATNMLVARAAADFIPPVALAFWRWFLVFLMMLPLAGPSLWRQREVLRAEWPVLTLLGALGMGVCGAFVYIGAHSTTATNIGLIYANSPVLIVLLAAVCFGERLRPVQLLGAGLAFAGMLVLVAKGDPGVLLDLRFVAGDLWIAAATLGWSVYSVVLRYVPSRLDGMTRFTAICLFGVAVLLPFHLWEAVTLGPPTLDLRTVGFVLLLAVVAGFAAYQVYGLILQTLGAARTGLLLYLMPLYNAGLAVLLLGERLHGYHLAGAALVIPGLLLANAATRRR